MPGDTAPPAPEDGAPDGTPAQAPAAPAAPPRLRILAPAPAPVAPLYRVVEVTRDSRGRLKEEGRVWHSDLNRARRFGRAVAANTAAQKVIVADAVGDALEELPVAGEGERAPAWGAWQQLPLPPLPPKKKSRKAKRPLPRPPSPPTPLPPAMAAALAAAEAQPAPPPAGAPPAAPDDDPPTAADVVLP
jgi:hypothetical protein